MKIGIKIGSNVLVGNGSVKKPLIKHICAQMAVLLGDGHQVFLVTSGAIASDSKTHRSENLRASVGQVGLMGLYGGYFAEFGYEVSQLLPTYHYLREENNESMVFMRIFKEGMDDKYVVPIINYNDSVDNREIDVLHGYRDNDNLFYAICCLVKTDMAIIGVDVEGVLDDRGKKVFTAALEEKDRILSYANGGNSAGYGKKGMITKMGVLYALAETGIYSVLAPGNEKNFILRAAAKEKDFGTIFKR